MSELNLDAALETFFEEAREMLARIEQSVLELEEKPDDVEELNALFRCAHTIKGSAGLFGLTAVVGFTHHVETLLDDLRDGKLELDLSLSSLLFACRDHIAVLLEQARTGAALDSAEAAHEQSLLQQLQAHCGCPDGTPAQPVVPVMAGNAGASGVDSASADDADDADAAEWHLLARFSADTFRDGFDPLSVIGYLSSIVRVIRVVPVLPVGLSCDAFDPEACHLSFDIRVAGEAEQSTIESAFELVREDCELIIQRHDPQALQPLPDSGLPSADDRLGDLLVRQGNLTPDELIDALRAQSLTQEPLGEILVVGNATSRPVIDAALSTQTKLREARAGERSMVRIPAEKLDQLINLVGELVIAGAGVHSLAQTHKIPALVKSTQKVNSLVEEVRNGALSMRMVQIGETFSRFRRIVRDVCGDLGKQVELELLGTESELDKSVVDQIVDPLMHIVRNALDHGIERPDERVAMGKPASGRLVMSAYHDSGQVVIQITDDGRGLARDRIMAKAIERGIVAPGTVLADKEILALVFAPGFSTAEAVTNLSGRGVGMDVVKRNIESLRGTVDLQSEPGKGTTVEIRLPLTLAIIDGFLVRVGRSHLVMPLDVVAECINTNSLEAPADGSSTAVMPLRGTVLPVIFLRQLFNLRGPQGTRQSIVVVRSGGRQAGIVV
ncbi:MAG TPA: chemotaxis protein CheA, partial [Burkholderiaceae bacterium]|nr:chemotaxis protein CheA [Burkholderiaceae bacterium]